jgi:three-Cys-motif partner protein
MPTTPHLFGGDWTTEKLETVRKYLVSYTTALKNTPFRIAYVDAFAGTGYRTKRSRRESGNIVQVPIPGFPAEYYERDSQEFLDGSARIALQVQPRFHKYFFIEKNPARCAELEKLKDEFPDKWDDINIEPEEANAYLQKFCRTVDWRTRRAVLFLDPYGMQVEWETIEAIGKTKAIDLWILFPLGVAVNRIVTRSGRISTAWRRRMDIMFGDAGWFEEFYRKTVRHDLFGREKTELEKVANFDSIGQYFVRRLKTVFYQVAENPRPLYNSRNIPLFLLCFATGNAKGAPIAMRIANHILKG